MFFEQGARLAEELGPALLRRGWRLCAAESCTGGLASALCTHVPGSSAWFTGALVSYADKLKTGLLAVPETLIADKGAVSRETALAMAAGVARLCGARCALAISGIAGPDGGSPSKPVGTVAFAWALPPADWGQVSTASLPPAEYNFSVTQELRLAGAMLLLQGGRRAVREQAALFSLRVLLGLLALDPERGQP